MPKAEQSDTELIKRMRNSDKEAFQLLFEQYQPTLFRFALYHVRDVETAHDVVQETFIRVWNHRESLQPNLSLLAYLFRISKNLTRDHAKHQAVRRRLEPDIPNNLNPTGNDPDESLRASMLEERLAEVIRTKLPAKCREVFLLSRMEEMSNTEISRHLHISVKTVENQITRALRILKKHMREYMGSD